MHSWDAQYIQMTSWKNYSQYSTIVLVVISTMLFKYWKLATTISSYWSWLIHFRIDQLVHCTIRLPRVCNFLCKHTYEDIRCFINFFYSTNNCTSENQMCHWKRVQSNSFKVVDFTEHVLTALHSTNHVWKVFHHADTIIIIFIINLGDFYLRFSIKWYRFTICRFK